MKKLFALLTALVLVAALAGCGGSSKYQDGSYKARTSDTYAAESGHGWQDTMSMTVSGGKITNVEYNAVNTDSGELKSDTTSETYPMEPHPSEWIPQINEQLTKATKVDDIDGITGATNSSTMARELYTALLTAAENGNTDEVIIH